MHIKAVCSGTIVNQESVALQTKQHQMAFSSLLFQSGAKAGGALLCLMGGIPITWVSHRLASKISRMHMKQGKSVILLPIKAFSLVRE